MFISDSYVDGVKSVQSMVPSRMTAATPKKSLKWRNSASAVARAVEFPGVGASTD
jgi:hypothetical protein